MTRTNRYKIENAALLLGVTLLPDEEIKQGDLYLACRNLEPVLLTAHEIKDQNPSGMNFIIPTTLAYFYDTVECVKVSI